MMQSMQNKHARYSGHGHGRAGQGRARQGTAGHGRARQGTGTGPEVRGGAAESSLPSQESRTKSNKVETGQG